jgi:RHS repeat-associated protein
VRPADEAAGRASQTLELVFSEKVQQAGGTIALRDGGGEVVADAATPTDDSRRWTMAFDPALVEGDAYTLYLSGFEDLAGNAMAVVTPIEIGFTAPAEDAAVAIPGTTQGGVLAIIDGPDGLAFVSGAPIDPDSVAASTISLSRSGNEVTGSLTLVDASTDTAWDGRVLLWTPDDPAAYIAARYDLVLAFNLVDVAGNPLRGPPTATDFFHHGQSDIVWSQTSETPLLGGSQIGNDRFLHGRPYISSLGLYDHRARFYEPGTQLFLEPDPLGPVDSPNLYQAFGFDGLNVTDPWGTYEIPEEEIEAWKAAHPGYRFGEFMDWIDARYEQARPPDDPVWYENAWSGAVGAARWVGRQADALWQATGGRVAEGVRRRTSGAMRAHKADLDAFADPQFAALGFDDSRRRLVEGLNEAVETGAQVTDVAIDAAETGTRFYVEGKLVVATTGAITRVAKRKEVALYNARTNADITQSVLTHIDPRRLDPNTRFGRALYLAERGETAVAEVAYHGSEATHLIRFQLNVNKARVLDFTDPAIASRWGYVGGNDYALSQAAAARARASGFNTIKYPSLRGPGSNYAVLDDFDELLKAQMVTPAR